MRKPIRRVVTGHDAAGRSVFITDAAAPHVYNRAPGSAVVTELWETRAMPADNSGNDEVTDHPFRLAPPRNGSVFRIVEYPPDKERAGRARAAARERRRRLRSRRRLRPRISAPSRLSQDQLGGLRHRAFRRDLRADGRGRGAAQSGGRPGPARHQPCLEQSHRRAGPSRLRAHRRRAVIDALRPCRPLLVGSRALLHDRSSIPHVSQPTPGETQTWL